MGARAIVARTLRTVARAMEGGFRPGPYSLPFSGGWLPDGAPINFWQCGGDVLPASNGSAVVEGCISAYAQTVATCPGDHWQLNDKGGRDRVTTSAASRILRRPNDYQSMSDFMLNATDLLYREGNAYALALRNDRYEVQELHLMDSFLSRPQLAQTGDIFYRLYGNPIIERRLNNEPLVVPARDVLHIRLHADRSRRYPFPLWGQTPLLAALDDVGVSSAITAQQQQFYLNQARPSAVLSTDLVIDKDQTQSLRDRWDEQSKGMAIGKTPILTSGLKVQPWNVGAKDSQLAEVLKISEEHIALAYRVPLPILGLSGGQTFASTETLMQFWIASGLGFCLNHIEESFGVLFQMRGQPEEYIEFDTTALLRSAMKDRLDALTKGVQGGIYAPNEARAFEGLEAKPFGDEPRVQQQVVPLSQVGKIPAAPAGPAPPSAPPTPPEPQDDAANDDTAKDVRQQVQRLLKSAARARRHFS